MVQLGLQIAAQTETGLNRAEQTDNRPNLIDLIVLDFLFCFCLDEPYILDLSDRPKLAPLNILAKK